MNLSVKAKVAILLLLALLLFRGGKAEEPSPLKEFKGTYVLVLDNFDDRRTLPKDQLSILTSPTTATWLDKNVTEWRKLDAVKDEGNADKPWVAKAFERAKSKPLPFLGVWSERGWWEGPLPENVTAFQGRVMKAKGELR